MNLRLCAGFIVLILLCSTVSADIPQLISVQGRLTDETNQPYTGMQSFVFSIYDDVTGGSLLWSEAHDTTPDYIGLFTVNLGSNEELGLSFDDEYYLEVKVNGEILSPRYSMASAAYAFSMGPGSLSGPVVVTSAGERAIEGKSSGHDGVMGYTTASGKSAIYGWANNGNAYSGYFEGGKGVKVGGDVQWTGTLQGGSVPWARLSGVPAGLDDGDQVGITSETDPLSLHKTGGTISGDLKVTGRIGINRDPFYNSNLYITPDASYGIIVHGGTWAAVHASSEGVYGGVHGSSDSSKGVYGDTRRGIGVKGEAYSSEGYAGYFAGGKGVRVEGDLVVDEGITLGGVKKTSWASEGIGSCSECDSRFINAGGDTVAGDLKVTSKVKASQYCDENGNNCKDASAGDSGGQPAHCAWYKDSCPASWVNEPGPTGVSSVLANYLGIMEDGANHYKCGDYGGTGTLYCNAAITGILNRCQDCWPGSKYTSNSLLSYCFNLCGGGTKRGQKYRCYKEKYFWCCPP
ncbi:MAG: hypothetical protein U9P44_00095 [archaeon]|nr:hypothetical protein [archaeon]